MHEMPDSLPAFSRRDQSIVDCFLWGCVKLDALQRGNANILCVWFIVRALIFYDVDDSIRQKGDHDEGKPGHAGATFQSLTRGGTTLPQDHCSRASRHAQRQRANPGPNSREVLVREIFHGYIPFLSGVYRRRLHFVNNSIRTAGIDSICAGRCGRGCRL
jgi:hypothetical protein